MVLGIGLLAMTPDYRGCRSQSINQPEETQVAQIKTPSLTQPRLPEEKPDPTVMPPIGASNKGDLAQRQSLATNPPAKSSKLELIPPEITVPKGKRAVIVSAKPSVPGVEVGWFVLNDPRNKPVEYLELPGQPFIIVFPNDVDELIKVYAFTAIDNKPVMVLSQITVGGGVVATPNTPGPITQPTEPLPTGTRLHFTILRDSDAEKVNPKLADLVNSTALIGALSSRGHQRWVMDVKYDAALIADKGFNEYIAKVKTLPLYVVQRDNGAVIDAKPLVGTPQAIVEALDRLAPGAK